MLVISTMGIINMAFGVKDGGKNYTTGLKCTKNSQKLLQIDITPWQTRYC